VLPLARKLDVALLRLVPSLACAVHPGLLATFFNNLLIVRMQIVKQTQGKQVYENKRVDCHRVGFENLKQF
jgi:hypothetical protein